MTHLNDPDDYIAEGFNNLPPKQGGKDPTFCTHFLQKRVRGAYTSTTLYFINVYIYDMTAINSGPCYMVSAEARLYNQATGSFGMDIQVDAKELGGARQIVAFYADAYARLGCVPDPHNN